MNKTVNANSKELLSTRWTENCEMEASGKLLCVNASASISRVDCLNKELRVNLVTTFRGVKEEDGYDIAVCKKESTVSIVSEHIGADSRCVLVPCVVGCSSKDTKCVADVEIKGWLIKDNELKFLDGAEGVYCRTEKRSVENVKAVGVYRHQTTESLETRLPIKKIIDFHSSVIVLSTFPSNGLFHVDGEIVSRVVSLTDNDIFVTQTFTSPLSVEIECDDSTEDSIIDVFSQVADVNLSVNESDDRVVIADFDIKLLYSVIEKQEIDGIVDCYSRTSELIVEERISAVGTNSCYRGVKEKISATVKESDGIEELLFVSNGNVGDINIVKGNGLKVEGIFDTDILYVTAGGVKKERCAIPFSTVVAGESDCGEVNFAEVKVLSTTARLRNGSEAEVSAELFITVSGTKVGELKLVSSIEEGAKKEDTDIAISLYIVKPNETLWDVAKALNTDEDTVLRLNPELKLPLSGGEKVIIYNELLFDI